MLDAGTWFDTATKQLYAAGVVTARLDCLVLLEDALGVNRAIILAHPELPIPLAKVLQLNNKIAQRANHVPLAYLRGKAEFYGREFGVNDRVLVPRPESEDMIDIVKKLKKVQRIADIGTGSGCLGITAALELPKAAVALYDIDEQAVWTARANAKRLGATVTVHQADLLSSLPVATVFLANLPYVPDTYPINTAASHEPRRALFAGVDGLDIYKRFWADFRWLAEPPRHVLTESMFEQHEEMVSLARAAGYRLTTIRGYIQHFTTA